MKYFFDTSVLVPAFVEEHLHHQPSFDLYVKADRQLGCCGLHSLAEVYAALTRMPAPIRVSGDQAALFVEAIRERLTIVALDADEYAAAIEEAASLGIVGGAVYDLLLARCALKARAEILYTWNLRDFQRFGPKVSGRVRTPPSVD